MTGDAGAPDRVDAVVVGSGPNGLAAAVMLARAGLAVELCESQDTLGGGARTLDLGFAGGVVHDICSAVHAMGVASPFLQAFDLSSRGVQLNVPEASYAQPLDREPAAIAWHDLDRTAEELGADAGTWRGFFRPLVEHAELVVDLALGDKRSIPRELLSPTGVLTGARFGVRLATQGTRAWGLPFRTERARALLMGVAAHSIGPLPSLGGASTALLLATIAHAGGWPIPVGGSQVIADALLADFRAHGGQVRTGVHVDSWTQLPNARAVVLDTTAAAAAGIMGEQLPASLSRALRRFRHGNAAAKVDFVLSGPVPWRDADVSRAGTVHLGGTRAQMAQAETEVAAGRTPEHPVTLVSDPSVADPARIHRGMRPLWSYAHVPQHDPTDPTELMTRQIERFAPGFRDVIVDAHAVPASEMARCNPSLVGGDIAMGRVTMWDMIARPTARLDPFRLGDSGAYLCSSAAPPGPGVHGMGGWHAARRVLRHEFGITRMPRLGPHA